MKNILSKEEFKHKLNEAEGGMSRGASGGLDFSNRTLWSQSLIGRGVNKLFSFVKRSIDIQILKGLKSELEDEYLKAIFIALKKLGKKPEDITANEEKKEEFNNEATKEINKLEKEGNIVALPAHKEEEVKKEVKKISVVKFVEKDTADETIKNQISFINSYKDQISSEQLSDDSKKLLTGIKAQLEQEISRLSGNTTALTVVGDMKKKVEEIINKTKTEKEGESEEELKKKYTEEFLEEKRNEYEKAKNALIQNFPKEKKRIIHTFESMKHLTTKSSVFEIRNAINAIDNFIKKFETVQKENYYLFNKYYSEFLNETKSYQNYEKINESKVGKIELKKLFGHKRETDQEFLKVFGKQKLEELDFDKLVEIFSDPENNTVLRNSVNKEALKEIQIKAEWLYDTEKWKDARDDVYSRVNWSTTHPDMKKLESSWKKMVANVKAAYNPIFSAGTTTKSEGGTVVKTGNFPQELDPIALVNSDKNFRQNFRQYGENGDYTRGLKYTSETSKKTPSDITTGLKLTEVKNGLPDNNLGILVIKTTTKKTAGILVYKFKIDNAHCWVFCGLIDYENLAKESNGKNYDDVKNLIKQYTYSEAGQITDDELKKLFLVLRPLNKDYGITIDSGKLFEILVASQNAYSPADNNPNSKNFIQCSIYNNSNAWISETNSQESTTKLNIEKVIDINKIDQSKKDIYKIYFKICEVFSIRTKEDWIKPEKLGKIEECMSWDITKNSIDEINNKIFNK